MSVTVKTELGSTKPSAENHRQPDQVTGDLGVQSGYIATNGKELRALKRLGERNYFEFTLLTENEAAAACRRRHPRLRKPKTKHNKYTLDVMADDKMTEKKDKNLLEPVQFYVAKAGHQPYELVVNNIQKDKVVGYLATPKDAAPRN